VPAGVATVSTGTLSAFSCTTTVPAARSPRRWLRADTSTVMMPIA
jgi:hypothetical protein